MIRSQMISKAYTDKHRGFFTTTSKKYFHVKTIHRNNGRDNNRHLEPFSRAFLLSSSSDLFFHSPALLHMHT